MTKIIRIALLGSLWLWCSTALSADIGGRVGLVQSVAPRYHWPSPFDGVLFTVGLNGLVGGQVALYYRFAATPRLSFQPELNFVMKGITYHTKTGGDYGVRFNYLELPLLLNFHITRILEVFGGPYVSTLVHSTSRSEIDWLNRDCVLRDLDAGLSVGLRVFVQEGWFLEARWTHGLINVAYAPNNPDIIPYKNRSLSVSLGFELGR